MRRGRGAARFATWVVVGLLVGVALAVTAPRAVGWQTHTVMSGSMSPAIATGDVVVGRSVPASQIRSGDVVTFKDPSDPSRLLTHRVQHVETAGGTTSARTRGDANTGTETWQVPADGTVGVVVYRLPRVGYVLHAAGSPAGRVALVAVPAVLWGLLSLIDLWRPRPAPARPSAALVRPTRLAELRDVALLAPRLPGPSWTAPVRLALPAGPRPLAALPPGPATPATVPVAAFDVPWGTDYRSRRELAGVAQPELVSHGRP